MVSITGNSVGDNATYICVAGYELVGNDTTQCVQVDNNSAFFMPQAPTCRRKLTSQYTYL